MCSGTFPLAHDRGTNKDDPQILETDELKTTVHIGNPDGFQCDGETGSVCTRQGNQFTCNLCVLGSPSYCEYLDLFIFFTRIHTKHTRTDTSHVKAILKYLTDFPISGEPGKWRCLGTLAASALGLSGQPNFQIMAIQDVNRWHFACVVSCCCCCWHFLPNLALMLKSPCNQ